MNAILPQNILSIRYKQVTLIGFLIKETTTQKQRTILNHSHVTVN